MRCGATCPAPRHSATKCSRRLTATSVTLDERQTAPRGTTAAPLVNIENFEAKADQSPYAIAQDLQYIMGAGLRQR